MPRLPDLVDGALEATIVGSFTRVGPAVRRVLDGWTPVEDLPGAGRRVLVTGANSGLGLATARDLARAGADLHLLVRSDEKATATRDAIHAVAPTADVTWTVADLLHLDQVREAAADVLTTADDLFAVVHNAGAMFPERAETEDGIERTVALHVVAPHLLTHLLLDRLAERGGRVVWMSSGGMYSEPLRVKALQSPDDYGPSSAYARAKRAQVVLAEQWQRRLGDHRGVVFHAMHPGWALTPGVESSLPVFRTIMGPLLRSPESGAETAAWLCLSDEAGAARGGQFWLDRRPRGTEYLPSTRTRPAEVEALWAEVQRLAGLASAGQGA